MKRFYFTHRNANYVIEPVTRKGQTGVAGYHVHRYIGYMRSGETAAAFVPEETRPGSAIPSIALAEWFERNDPRCPPGGGKAFIQRIADGDFDGTANDNTPRA